MFHRIYSLLSILAASVSFASAQRSPLDFTFNSTPALDLQPLFDEQSTGWLGADIATTIELQAAEQQNTLIWLFGDTLVGSMKRNSSGQDQRSIKMPLPATPSSMSFIWRDEVNGYFVAKNESHWFWPTAGVSIGKELYVFAYEVFRQGTGPFAPLLGFNITGTSVVMVSDTTLPPVQWSYVQQSLPHTNSSLNFASAATVWKDSVYLLGYSTEEESASSVLARISVSSLQKQQWSAMEYWSDVQEWSVWSENLTLSTLFDEVGTESSLNYHPLMDSWYVLSLPFGSSSISIRLADQLTGPWSDAAVVYDIPLPWNLTSSFCYAPKSHPLLTAANDEIVFTYNTNGDIVHRSDLYLPRVVRVQIQTE